MTDRIDTSRDIKARHGIELDAKSWFTEAPLRMLMNNLDKEVAENPAELVVYGGIGRAARNWQVNNMTYTSICGSCSHSHYG